MNRNYPSIVVDTEVKFFPWKDFSLWLRDGLQAGSITNKLMSVSSPDSNSKAIESQRWLPDELGLLKRVAVGSTGDCRGILDKLIKAGRPVSLEEQEVRVLWEALVMYILTSSESESTRSQLRSYLSQWDGVSDVAVAHLLDSLLRVLGPAMGTERSELEKIKD